MFEPFRSFYRSPHKSPYRSPYRSPCGLPSSRLDCNPFDEHASRKSERISFTRCKDKLEFILDQEVRQIHPSNKADFSLKLSGKVFRNRRRFKNRKFWSNTFCPSYWMKRFLAFTLKTFRFWKLNWRNFSSPVAKFPFSSWITIDIDQYLKFKVQYFDAKLISLKFFKSEKQYRCTHLHFWTSSASCTPKMSSKVMNWFSIEIFPPRPMMFWARRNSARCRRQANSRAIATLCMEFLRLIVK